MSNTRQCNAAHMTIQAVDLIDQFRFIVRQILSVTAPSQIQRAVNAFVAKISHGSVKIGNDGPVLPSLYLLINQGASVKRQRPPVRNVHELQHLHRGKAFAIRGRHIEQPVGNDASACHFSLTNREHSIVYAS